ncbi:amidase signature enzyme [Cryphonectria parasitica EP155]|uniref:Glutamyl-tRNA(Gln) amidotransferase subunit A, mitochondrial n=1 Tax=Cryphonectria parasitica (strain ATCC 38755 / EP155) TaxID=660469 RepID=A0A9P4Y950_CRYP1|nr:amidase signature enzyme [Cryphonectria parasitica EP155]KAF3768689.1 amidase signature enzyme [Cryphonectria parasitica EP155]
MQTADCLCNYHSSAHSAALDAESETTAPPHQPKNSFRLAVKDNIATLPSDGSTTCASGILADHASPFEATVIAQLRRRGAVVVGKTNLDEFGMGGHSMNSVYGPVVQKGVTRRGPGSDSARHNDSVGDGPADRMPVDFSAGGSSGGSALAVASGTADVALGTDTGGSVRLPAAYCGVIGYKPSYGMISRYGVVPYANSLDTVGFLAGDVRKIRELVVEGGLWAEHDPRDPTSLSVAARARCAASRDNYRNPDATGPGGPTGSGSLRPLTFGIPLEYNIEELEPCVRQAWQDTATLLRDKIGARVVPVSLPSTKHALSAYYVIAPAEASSNLAKYDGVRYGPRQPEIEGNGAGNGVLYSAVRGQGFGAEVKRRILLGSYTLSSEAMDNYFVQAQRVRRLVRRDFDRVFQLANPLLDEDDQHFDLADLDEGVTLENKLGPAQVDFLLCPTAPTLPPTLAHVQARQERNPTEAYMNDVLTVPASLAGLPAISIPRGVKGASVPGPMGIMGLQVIGQFWDDARLLAAAEALAALGEST